jgi:hypothetical protein
VAVHSQAASQGTGVVDVDTADMAMHCCYKGKEQA